MKTPDAVDVVSPEDWKQAREEMLVKEKEYMRAGDALAAERRRMPWLAVEKDYEFVGPDGKMSFEDLFQGRRQLVVYRAFYDPGITTTVDPYEYPERACGGCSFMADQMAHPAHLGGRDTALAFVSRSPLAQIQDLQERMGTSGTGRTPSSAPTTGSSVPTSSTPAATKAWAPPGASSTSPRSDGRRSGRTRPKDTRRPTRTSGGTTTATTRRTLRDRRNSGTRRRPPGRGAGAACGRRRQPPRGARVAVDPLSGRMTR